MADASRGLSRWEESTSAFGDAIAIYRELGDRLEEARAQVRHALVFRDQYLSGQAIPLITAGLEVVRELGDRPWEARAMRQLAIVHRNAGDTATAITLPPHPRRSARLGQLPLRQRPRRDGDPPPRPAVHRR